MNIYEKLSEIQNKLKVSKENFNAFGKYKYRNCEDILEGVKPLLKEFKTALTLSDDVISIGDRFYIQSTATLYNTEIEETIKVTAYAREENEKKGMDASQLTGATSSYSRKYALNGLFSIDDTKDSDTTNEGDKKQPDKQTDKKPEVTQDQIKRLYTIANSKGRTEKQVKDAISKKFGITSASELTKVQYEEVCKGYEGLPDKNA